MFSTGMRREVKMVSDRKLQHALVSGVQVLSETVAWSMLGVFNVRRAILGAPNAIDEVERVQ